MNISQTDQTLFDDRRDIEREIASLFMEKQLFESKISWLSSAIALLQDKLKELDKV